jgi:hypothetical protein
MPTKWLKERQDGSKNEVGMPQRRASRGVDGLMLATLFRSRNREITALAKNPTTPVF